MLRTIFAALALATPAIAQDECRADRDCWADRFHETATDMCTASIDEMMSNSETRWTEGMFDWRFDRYAWADADEGVVTYMSNAMEINIGGTWVASRVECDFDGDTAEVVEVRQN